MRLVAVEITGTAPLLIHRFGEEAEQGKASRKIEVSSKDPREEATKVAYIARDGTFYFNALAIPSAMANAGSAHKMRGSRKTLRFIVPSAVSMTSDSVTIRNGDHTAAKGFEVDSRPVTIPATKGRIMRHRPRFDNWSAQFDLRINDNLISVEDCHMLLQEAGTSYGIGDFRPEKRGPFGTFMITSWKEQK